MPALRSRKQSSYLAGVGKAVKLYQADFADCLPTAAEGWFVASACFGRMVVAQSLAYPILKMSFN